MIQDPTVNMINILLIKKNLPPEIRYVILSYVFDPLTLFYSTKTDITHIYSYTISTQILNKWGLDYPYNFELSPREVVTQLINLCKNLELPFYTSKFLTKKIFQNKYIEPPYIKHFPHNILNKIVNLNNIPLLKFVMHNNIFYPSMEQYFKDIMLAEACYKNKFEMTKYLILIGANVNSNYNKPLYYAISNKNIKIAKFLIENNAKIEHHYILAFIDYCIKNNNQDVVNLIYKKIFN